MIRKFLVCNKQPFLASKRLEEGRSKAVPVVELLLPIQVFWELEILFKKADYMAASGEDGVLINDVYQKIYRKILKYAVQEKERHFLQGRLHSG